MPKTRDPIDVDLGARLRAMRTARRMSMEALGRKVGVTYQQIQKYESGMNSIRAATLIRLAQALNCETSDLLVSMPMPEGDAALPAPSASRLGLADEPLPGIQDLQPELRGPVSALIKTIDALHSRPRTAAPAKASAPLAH
ncbi:helix-turn-helix domain-containing protein [Aureimonas ureilytica]|uniref:helix-turn-helix domain-containing protein n=1 Tax=Aureimonas ureilytica TaxID=401562 RepID=UPI00073501AF|nr:helix-turn-helix domain-containing protein [Aureimonas ureilytica]